MASPSTPTSTQTLDPQAPLHFPEDGDLGVRVLPALHHEAPPPEPLLRAYRECDLTRAREGLHARAGAGDLPGGTVVPADHAAS